MHRSAEACPHCGYSLAEADEQFGAEEVRVEKLTDRAGVLRVKERRHLKKELEDFERQFPQLFFTVHLTAVSGVRNVRQFGFWLLNRGAFSDVALDRPNEGGILLTVDVAGKTCGLTYGYWLEPFLGEEATFEALSAAHPFFLQGEYLRASRVVLRKTRGILRKKMSVAAKDPKTFFEANTMSLQGDDSLEKIRTTQKNPSKKEEKTNYLEGGRGS